MTRINAFTIDVEDYFQVEAFTRNIKRDDWDSFKTRVSKNTHVLLDLLEKNNVKATFFVLGWVAKRYPELVKDIDQCGHEVASHGMSHKLIYKQTRDEFRKETFESRDILENIIQKKVLGYRAATYSITKQSLWALDILCEAGFKYDSSIFPIVHDRYGIPGTNTDPHIITTEKNNKIVEFPISVYQNRFFNVPVSGGGYFRLFPYLFTKTLLNSINKNDKEFIFYIHPWEIDSEQPRIEGISPSTKFRHYNNLDHTYKRLEKLLNDFEFSTTRNVLHDLGLLKV